MNRSLHDARSASGTMNDSRWASILAHDSAADGTFFYSVATTGVYCKPSCAARRPRPENVDFYTTIAEAEQAGFRPCKRCKPNEPPLLARQADKITAVCVLIERSKDPLSLEQLAESAGLSAYHFHRLFKSIIGVTPRQYEAEHRAKRVRTELQKSSRVTDAIYEAGYNSNGRFYEASNQMLGMTPSRYRAGGAKTEIRFAVGECLLGSILVAQGERGICAILLGDDPEALVKDLEDRFPRANLVGGDAEFEKLVSRVVGFVEAPSIGLDLPLDIRGTAFQQRVWQILQKIPAGAKVSYSDVAAKIGSPKAVRAVAQACAANALAVAIPCHRVVRQDGEVSGYRWGVERKRTLLEREARG